MENRRQLNAEELNNITGGSTEYNSGSYALNLYKEKYNVPVDRYSVNVGETYLFVNCTDSEMWLFGKLVNVYEKRRFIFWSDRMFDILVSDGNKETVYNDGGTLEVSGDCFQAYAMA